MERMGKRDQGAIVGFTWYSLTDQVDWDSALREDNNNVNPLGLYDLDRNIRPVGESYKQLINEWREVLPTQSNCLHVPVVRPGAHRMVKQANIITQHDERNDSTTNSLLQASKKST